MESEKKQSELKIEDPHPPKITARVNEYFLLPILSKIRFRRSMAEYVQGGTKLTPESHPKMVQDYDGYPYLTPVLEEPNPEEVTKVPSAWRRIRYLLFGR